jgi:hypothetical protein
VNDAQASARQLATERRVRLAGLLVLLGLIVEATSICILHPLSFLVFLVVGGALSALGIVVFLLALLRAGE